MQSINGELPAEGAELKTKLERLTSWAAKNQAARETLQNEIEKLKSQNPKQHPVKVGEWVRRTTPHIDGTPAGSVQQVRAILPAGTESSTVVYEMQSGSIWAVDYCEPCDPPSHDTEAGKAVAESADAKIIAGLRSEIGAARMAVLERDSLMSERDGLLTQVQDMRAEISRLTGHNADAALHDLLRREYDKALTLCETDEQTPEQCIGSLNARIDRLQNDARSDARVREELHRINVELRAEVDFLKTLRPKYKVGDKLESSYSSAVTIVGVRTVYDCQADGASYAVGHSEAEINKRYVQAPKHPVKVGTWVRRLVPSPACDVGTVAKVVHVDDDTSEIEYDVKRIDGQHGVWFAKNCEPCDQPATHATEAGKAAVESVIRDSRSAEIEMCVGDEVEVICQSVPMPTGMFANFIAPVGTRGTATMIHRTAGFVELDNGTRASIKDVRKVTT